MDIAVVDIIIRIISAVGFPIFVAVWLLIRTDTLLRKLTESIDILQECMLRLEGRLNDPR